MADTKIVGGKSGGGGGGGGGKDDCCDCRVDGVTLGGEGTKRHPFKAIALPGAQPFAALTTIINARPDGDDECGDGSLDKPYATFQKAIDQVPLIIQPGNRFIVDITGVQELLPPDYAVPPIKSWGYYSVLPADDLDTRVFSTPLVIRAQYIPFSGVPIADRTIEAGEVSGVINDPVTGLITISTTKSYALNALAGAIIQTSSSPKRTAMVYGNTAGPNSVLILANTSGSPVWFAGPFALLEQSATLTAQNGIETYKGVSFRHIDSFFVDGIKFRNSDPNQFDPEFSLNHSVNCIQSSSPVFGACDIEGIYVGPGTQYFYGASTMFRNKTIESEGQTELFFAGSVLQDMATLYTYDVEFLSLSGCGVRNCAALGPRPIALFTPTLVLLGSGVSTKISVTFSQIDGSVPDTDFFLPGYGILNNALAASIANVRISDCESDAIYCTSNSSAALNNVSGSGNGAGGAGGGVGVFADMGSQVSVDAATTVSGVLNDVKAGSLGAVGYGALIPGVAQQYDAQPADISTVATGARIFRV